MDQSEIEVIKRDMAANKARHLAARIENDHEQALVLEANRQYEANRTHPRTRRQTVKPYFLNIWGLG